MNAYKVCGVVSHVDVYGYYPIEIEEEVPLWKCTACKKVFTNREAAEACCQVVPCSK